MRADVFLTERGYVDSRTRASRLIDQGCVLIDGKTVLKASTDISDTEHDVVISNTDRYVGRGGLKLEAALESFKIDVCGKKCIDMGASTGGFTDCLLQNGAREVYAVDSGRGQLHKSLLSDNRVVNIEGYNARELSKDNFGSFDVAVMDVSFISQTLIHPAISSVIMPESVFISLIKPQFEAGRSAIGKNGIVKSAKDRENAIHRVIESARLCGFRTIGLIVSPIKGGDGNVEYLACFERTDTDHAEEVVTAQMIKQLVSK